MASVKVGRASGPSFKENGVIKDSLGPFNWSRSSRRDLVHKLGNQDRSPMIWI